MSKAWARGSTRAWRKLRAQILAHNLVNNGGKCKANIAGTCTTQATQVHHVLGKAAGDDPRYLQAVCAECNKAIGDPNAGRQPAPRIIDAW